MIFIAASFWILPVKYMLKCVKIFSAEISFTVSSIYTIANKCLKFKLTDNFGSPLWFPDEDATKRGFFSPRQEEVSCKSQGTFFSSYQFWCWTFIFFFVLMLGGSKLILTSWLIHANCCRTIFASFLFIPLFIKLACPANAKLDVNKTSSRQQLEGLTFHFSSLLFLVFLDYWIKSKVALTFSFQLLLPSVLNISYLYSVFFFKLVSGFLCRPSLSLTYNQLLNS